MLQFENYIKKSKERLMASTTNINGTKWRKKNSWISKTEIEKKNRYTDALKERQERNLFNLFKD